MTLFKDLSQLLASCSLAVAAVGAAPAWGVQVDVPSQAVQLRAGCEGDTSEFCGLRIYQVMVEAFVDGDPNYDYNAGYGTSHHRGDLRGVIDSLPYIKSSGMNAIWMTPIFDSHAGGAYEGGGPNLKLDATGYYARDYFQIDPNFGTLADARELVDTAHALGMYVLFDGVFGHHKGNLVPSPTGKLPVNSSPGVVNFGAPASVEFYQEVASYWIDELGIDGWRFDQAYQVPPAAWQSIKSSIDAASEQRAQAGEEWGTLGYGVAEVWSGADYISQVAYGTNASSILDSAFDFPVRYATVGVIAGEESGWAGRPASTLADSWSYGAHDQTYPDHALPNLMIGNHDLVRFGDLLQRVGLASPNDQEYWARHRLAFMVQGAYSGPITRYYGEEIGDELPGYANQVTSGCATLGLCDDHVARTSGKILGVTVNAEDLSSDQHALLEFHQQLMTLRSQYPALSHGSRQHLYSDEVLYVDLKSHGQQEIVFAMNLSDEPMAVQLNAGMFASTPPNAWDLLGEVAVDFEAGYLSFTLAPLSGRYILLAEGPTVLAGDYNADGVVDAADYALWRESLDQMGAGLAADGDLSGVVDSGDFDLWKANYGAVAPATLLVFGSLSGPAAPEPSSLVFLWLAVMGPLVTRRRAVRLRRVRSVSVA